MLLYLLYIEISIVIVDIGYLYMIELLRFHRKSFILSYLGIFFYNPSSS
jgi:hypothetical protein